VFNTGGHVAQFWDGRAPTLEVQAKGPILNPIEMAMAGPDQVARALDAVPEYRRRFRRAFPGDATPVHIDNVARAISAFERQLVTPGRFDRFLQGESDALTSAEKRGMVRFVQLGCATCHNGPGVGGTSFQRLGLSIPYPNQADLGRFTITHRDEDRMVFRVPGLRNVARTAPYFHDGGVKGLEEAVRAMAHHQLGLRVGDGDVVDITAFLRALTGELPKAMVSPPVLPGTT
jgi:cytochrome c peroxidase